MAVTACATGIAHTFMAADALTAGCRLAAQATQHLGARPSLDVVDNQIK